jgi:hypothetical protein
MHKPSLHLSEKLATFKHAFSSRQAAVKYLEAPLLEGDEDNLKNRRVSPHHNEFLLHEDVQVYLTKLPISGQTVILQARHRKTENGRSGHSWLFGLLTLLVLVPGSPVLV